MCSGESAQLVQLRRDLKDRTAQLTILEQRYDHLDARFKTVRENHEKVLTQMQDLNRALRDERTENTRLKHELHQSSVLQEDLQERQTLIVHSHCQWAMSNGRRLPCCLRRYHKERAVVRVYDPGSLCGGATPMPGGACSAIHVSRSDRLHTVLRLSTNCTCKSTGVWKTHASVAAR